MQKAEVLKSLAESLEGEDRFGQLLRRVEGQCEALSSLSFGGGFVLSWPETRQKSFLEYLEFKRYEPANARNMLNYLDRFVKKPIRAPMDVMKTFSPLTAGQRHHLHNPSYIGLILISILIKLGQNL